MPRNFAWWRTSSGHQGKFGTQYCSYGVLLCQILSWSASPFTRPETLNLTKFTILWSHISNSLTDQQKISHGRIVHCSTSNFTRIGASLHTWGARSSNLIDFGILGAPIPTPFTNQGEIRHTTVNVWFASPRQSHLWKLTKILNSRGFTPTHFTDQSQIWHMSEPVA